MDGIVEDAFAYFHVGGWDIFLGSSLQRVGRWEDYGKVFIRGSGEVDGNFTLEEKRVANGGENSVVQDFRLGKLCEGQGSFRGA